MMQNFNFNVVNGKINFNNSKLINNNMGTLKLTNSNLYVENNKLLLNSDLLIDIKDLDRLFSFLNTRRIREKILKKFCLT